MGVTGNLLASVDGGTDTLVLDGSGLTLGLTTIANQRIQDIEKIDLTGSGNNTLKVSLNDVLDISSETNTPLVFGDAGDKISNVAGSGFTDLRTDQAAGGVTYDVYIHASATSAQLLLDQDLAVI